MVRNGLENLRLHEDEVNKLNVFPVPDGDTGINMRLTLESGVKYAKSNEDIVFIDSYSVDDSTIDLSFQFSRQISLNRGMSLSLNLLLNNDEIRQSAVSMNAMFKVQYDKAGNSLYLKPSSYEVKPGQYITDMLTYTHAMKVSTVYEKIQTLPVLIAKYIQQVKDNAESILTIKDPQIIKDHLLRKVQKARKEEFVNYKESVIQKLIIIFGRI